MTPTMDKRLVELAQATIGFCGDSGDGMQLAGTQFTNTSAILGNDISTLPDFPAEIRAPAGTLAGVSGFQVHFSSHDIHTPGDQLNALVAMNPAALKTQPQGPRAGRHPHRQRGRLRRQRSAQGRLQGQSARRRLAEGLPRHLASRSPSSTARPSPTCKLQPARGRPLQELLRPGPGLLALRAAAGADAAVDPREVRQEPGRAGGQHRAPSRPATTTAKRPRRCRSTTASPRPSMPAGHVSQDHRQRSAGAGPGRRRRSWPTCTLVYAGYPITPASDILHHLVELKRFGVRTHPGRGRDRRHRHGHRRGVRRRARRHRHQRPGHLPQVRGDRPGRHDRTAAGHHRRAARRPQHRPADQDRAGRPAAGDVRPQRRMPGRPSSRPARRPIASPWRSRRCASPSAS